MRLECVKCGWMGSYMEARTALALSQRGTPCPNCGEALTVHFNSDSEQQRFGEPRPLEHPQPS